jgi:7,8-dihydroneopterin aldolase/epimerase/oxygenase
VSDVIELRELRVSAIVGVLTHERENEQPLELDIDIERSFQEAAASDDLAATTDYAAVLRLATRVTREGEFLLLETVARRVAKEILDFDDAIDGVTVAVRKLRPPVPDLVATVGVRCSLSR